MDFTLALTKMPEMPTHHAPDPLYRFGPFELDPASGELTQHGRRIRLAPQPSLVLSYLLEHAGELVPRQALIDALWNDGTRVDYEAGLNSAIKQIRRALGDRAAASCYLETLPRRGYRFRAPLTRVDRVVARAPVPSPGRYRRGALAAGLALTLGSMAAWYVIHRSRPPAPAHAPPPSPVAALVVDAYFKGQYLLDSGEGDRAPEAAGYFRRALELDPAYVSARVGLARALLRGAHAAAEPRPELERAHSEAEGVLRLAPDNGWALAVRARCRLLLDWDWAGAKSDYARALRSIPDDARLRHSHAYFLSASGDHEAAVEQIAAARRLDPTLPAINLDSAWIFFYARRYEEAIVEARRAIELEPSTFSAHYCLHAAQTRLGHAAEALEHAQSMMRLAGADPELVTRLPELDDRSRARAIRGWWTRDSGDTDWSLPIYVRGLIELDRGHHDAALDHLASSVERPESSAVLLAVDPRLDPLRDDPGFRRILRRIGRAG